MKILFISRAYPPVTGGIENQNYALSVWLTKVARADTIANRYGKRALPFFIPFATVKALLIMHRYDVLLLGDGVLAILGFIIKFFYPEKTVVSVVHGLDLTYKSDLYQTYWVRKFLPTLDGLIAVSDETKKIAVEKNIPENKVSVVHNGVETETFQKRYTRDDLSKVLGKDVTDRFVLLTAGRLAKRKGAEWFIRNVLPSLPENTLYVLAGDGPERENIAKATTDLKLEEKVSILGRVSDEVRNILLATADIFVQPNIPIQNDMEGFGIAVIEATSAGRPVVASALEGLKDAIADKENGILVPPENAAAFQNAIRELLQNTDERLLLGKRAKIYTEEHYHWKRIAAEYVEALNRFIQE